MARPFCRLLSSILWLRPRLGTHFCFYLLSLGVSCAIFFLLGTFWGQFSAILEGPDHRKTTNFLERVVKITLFVVFASGAALGLSWGGSWPLLGASGPLLASLLGPPGGLLGASWGLLGAFLAVSWRSPGASWRNLGSKGLPGASQRPPGASGTPSGVLLGASRGPLATFLETSCLLAPLLPSFLAS